jgi:hypothetical protein
VDGPFEGKNNNFDPVPSIKARYGVQLNVDRVPVWIVCLDLEIIAADQGDGTQAISPVGHISLVWGTLSQWGLLQFLFGKGKIVKSLPIGFAATKTTIRFGAINTYDPLSSACHRTAGVNRQNCFNSRRSRVQCSTAPLYMLITFEIFKCSRWLSYWFAKRREISADRYQWRAVWSSKKACQVRLLININSFFIVQKSSISSSRY